MKPPPSLRLLATTEDELLVVSAAVQDGLCVRSDIKYSPTEQSLTIEFKRFQWEAAGRFGPFFRRQSVLMVSNVRGVQAKGVVDIAPDTTLSLLSVSFEEKEAPSGGIRIHFAGGAEMVLDVECLDVTLMDTDIAWPTRRKPKHKSK